MYTNAQENVNYAGDIGWGIVSVISVIVGTICGIIYDIYWIWGYVILVNEVYTNSNITYT